MTDCATYPTGQCTWYCCSTWSDPVGPYWGDGHAWLASAAAAGYSTTLYAVPGAIAVWGANMGGTRDAGHVAIVTSVDPLTVRESNWSIPLEPDTRIVSDYSRTGIIGYILPKELPMAATIGMKRADIENFRIAAFGEWPPDLASVDTYAALIADDFSNVLEVHQQLLDDFTKNGGKPLWRSNLPASPSPPSSAAPSSS